ncbi:MAG: gamma carbonic anhydrase family protein [Desulfobacterales bacterium]|nr:gamma carbonic anhydrase family protein [Desulfobacterales bacterium]
MPLYQFEKKIPIIDSSAYIAPTACVIGNVIVKQKASIWFQSVVRGDDEQIIIGEASNIQDLSMLHADIGKPLIIGSNVTVGHRCILHGCNIEDNCLIGMGSIVLNGAVIGHSSVIAAGAVILENTVIPPYSLVAGIPGTIKKHFQENIKDVNQLFSESYKQRIDRYIANETGLQCISEFNP